jgi:decaprenylphospho-beta-D-ribofuranose 2-oxidase
MPKVSGWGRTIFSESTHLAFHHNLTGEQNTNERGAIARGLGRSYGDTAQNSGGIVVDCGDFKNINLDSLTGVVTVGSGVTIEELELESLKYGYFPYVVPGTGQITIGGAIASDIHGKSHHKVGSFCDHILELKMILANGEERTTGPNNSIDSLFEATVGGLGLTGVIIESKMQLMPIKSSMLSVNEVRVDTLDEMLKTLNEFDQEFHYTVAWLDLSGNYKGRGLVSGANFANTQVLSSGGDKRGRDQKSRRFSIRFTTRLNVVNRFTIRFFNFIWFHKPLTRKLQNIQRYLHPLDRISNWNELYGRHGLIQYQFVIPFENQDLLSVIIQKFASSRISSPLSVLKSLGSRSQGLLGFPMQGWTLAVDIPANTIGLEKVLNEIDEIVLIAGGRVYLTKDSRIPSGMIGKMYPGLQYWQRLKRRFDPGNFWQSDQSRRLKIC